MQAFKLRSLRSNLCFRNLHCGGLVHCCAGADAVVYVGWSVYAGWNPYFYMQKSGILKKWADKYGIAIKVQRFDYAASLDAFVAKNIDACHDDEYGGVRPARRSGGRLHRHHRRRLLERQ